MAWTPFNRTPPSLLLLTLLSWTGHVSSKTTRRGDISISMAYSNLDTTTFCSNLTIGEPDSCEDALIVPMYPNHQVPEGSLISPQKMWYARRLDDGVYISGQPTPRQIKYAADSGFKTVVSVFTHKGQLSPDGKEVLISTATEKFIVENLAGMKFFTVLDGDQDGDWNSVDAVRKMTEIIRQLELPALIHCRKGVVSTFLALLYYANQTVNDPDFKPRVNSTRFYEITRKHGLDFVKLLNYTSATVTSITGKALPKTARAPKVSLAQWYSYWASRPLYENWYTAGQINANDLYVIKATGFNQIVNLRKGTTHGGRPSQVSLLFI
ncbi:uncharacterized protein LOC131928777 [Physella acuta]|uniref:uncharacterized protein LOC131928777 n=1 Tax=Physella acuta TaxID=109671 RepID=UPI0027DE2438|nr:uncharacterized protein LOC131928777 [Physella acuta]